MTHEPMVDARRFTVTPPERALAAQLQARLDSRTKPQGSLGRLEELALQVGLIQRSIAPALRAPRIVVFVGDHGAAAAGVSAYPQAVTAQMVGNFLAGGAAINVLARANDFAVSVVDAGVAADLPAPGLGEAEFIAAKIAPGTRNYLVEPAMTRAQCEQAIERGMRLVRAWAAAGCNAIGFGEMGIGNTAAASLITHGITGAPLDMVIGRGTGLDDAGLARKRALLAQAATRSDPRQLAPLDLLAEFGGFEIAMMTGAYLQAARSRMVIVVDGFIATAALLVAHALAPAVAEYCVFGHRTSEPGQLAQHRHLGARPLLDLELRLGEGSGAALAFPLVRAALALLNEMAGFDDAGVSRSAADAGNGA